MQLRLFRDNRSEALLGRHDVLRVSANWRSPINDDNPHWRERSQPPHYYQR